MKSRYSKLPIIKAATYSINASYYNRIRIALLRSEKPIRIELVNLSSLDMIIDETEWVCVDKNLSDLPTVAWTDFKTSMRNGLHEPVACQIRHYNDHTDLVCETVLYSVYRYLEKESTPTSRDSIHTLNYLPPSSSGHI